MTEAEVSSFSQAEARKARVRNHAAQIFTGLVGDPQSYHARTLKEAAQMAFKAAEQFEIVVTEAEEAGAK